MSSPSLSLRSPPVKGGLFVFLVIIVLYSLLSVSAPSGTSVVPSLADIRSRLGVGAGSSLSNKDVNAGGSWDSEGGGTNATRKANAAFVILAKNSDVWGVLESMRGIEDRFNRKYNYPYVFLNDKPFSAEFMLHTTSMASGHCTYGIIPSNEWEDIPSWIDQDRMQSAVDEMAKLPIPYGDSVNYRKMCRYQSGWFWRHPLLDTYEFYWRIEPNVKFFCDINYDPFLLMQDQGKKYAFIITIYEYQETIVTLWKETKKFLEKYPQFLSKPNAMKFLSDDDGETYNKCHMWSNAEIASLDFWRGEAYRKYFDWLDQAGGFFYERWGDAPVHSIAAALFLKPSEIHFFEDIGYRHEPFQHCPKNRPQTCACDPSDSFEDHGYSCTPRWKKLTHFGS